MNLVVDFSSLLICICCILVPTWGQSPTASTPVPPPTVPTINLEAFKGRWYQMYASYMANTTFEPHGYCVTADYFGDWEATSGVAFSFVHSFRMCNPQQGMLHQATGSVVTTDNPGQFILLYSEHPAAMGYWVVALGDIPPGEQEYPWAVISAPHQYILFILARDVEHFRHHHQQHVLDWVKQHGYTQEVNKPLETFQGDQCQYAPLPEEATPTLSPKPVPP